MNLQDTLQSLEKQYGKGTVLKADQKPEEVEVISTGSLKLDLATGIGGFPRGRIVEIIGPESSGKTTVAYHTMVNAQSDGLNVTFIDMEHSSDLGYAKDLGVDTEKLYIAQPDYGEQALDIAEKLIRSGEMHLIVIDSVAALVPQVEVIGGVSAATVGRQAAMMSKACRILTPLAEKYGCMILFLNQIRMKIGQMYGSPETPAGGEALKYYASMRIDLRKRNDVEGQLSEVTAKVIKNKLAPPFGKADFEISWGRGIVKENELLDLGIELGIIQKAGSWISYDEVKVQGSDKFVQHMFDNPEWTDHIEGVVLTKLRENAS